MCSMKYWMKGIAFLKKRLQIMMFKVTQFVYIVQGNNSVTFYQNSFRKFSRENFHLFVTIKITNYMQTLTCIAIHFMQEMQKMMLASRFAPSANSQWKVIIMHKYILYAPQNHTVSKCNECMNAVEEILTSLEKFQQNGE